ncbi:MAG: amidase [Deltaproteobacteria bacterium]|nr:amidase [Deltaproteobacteria bacterium]
MKLWALTASEMLEGLERREFSARELVDAHLARIDELNGTVNAFVHRFDSKARAAADASDQRRRDGSPRPLEGLPISVKESVSTAGTTVTLGVVNKQSGPPAEADAVVVGILERAGAIVLGKTNVSQLLLFHESENPLFGVTKNPWRLDRVPGGSSGGEAAAIAAGMSPAGVGGDIGGSIRVPCAFTGIAGLKPTTDRWSNLGSNTALLGQEVVRGQCGPMARRARDVALLFEAVSPVEMSKVDASVAPAAYSSFREVDVSALTIGFYEDDGVVKPSASVRRAIRRAVEGLRVAGAKVVEFPLPFSEELFETYFGAVSSDGGATVDAHLEGEPIAVQLSLLRRVAGLPGPVRRIASEVLKRRGEPRVAKMLEAVHERSVAEHWKLAARRTDLRRRTLAAWTAAGVDALVTPVHATVALRHRDSTDFALGGFASMIYNVLGFPAGAVAVTLASTEDELRSANGRLDRRARSVEEGSSGLPVGVQVVGRPFADATVLAVMAAIEDAASASGALPKTPVTPGG